MPPRKKLEMLGLVERVIGMYHNDNMEVRAIEAVLKAEGFEVGKSSIQRTIRSYEDVAQKHQQALDEAQILIEKVKNTPNTDILEAINGIASTKLLDFIKSVDDFDFKDPLKFIDSLSQLSRAQVNMGRLRMEYEKGFEAAKKEFLQQLAEQLKSEPELLQKLRDIVQTLKAEGK